MKKDGGFSLVELIIVIAIIAIAIGVIAPQLIRYFEKSNVSSDTQLADTVRSSIALAVTDARVLADSASDPWITQMQSASGLDLSGNTALATDTCEFTVSLTDSLGFAVSDINDALKSARGDGCNCNVKLVNDVVVVTLTETDCTGRRDRSSSTPENDIVVK